MYTGKLVHEITEEEATHPSRVDSRFYHRFCRNFGRLLPCDAGKQVFDVGDGIWQMESAGQRDRRLGRVR